MTIRPVEEAFLRWAHDIPANRVIVSYEHCTQAAASTNTDDRYWYARLGTTWAEVSTVAHVVDHAIGEYVTLAEVWPMRPGLTPRGYVLCRMDAMRCDKGTP